MIAFVAFFETLAFSLFGIGVLQPKTLFLVFALHNWSGILQNDVLNAFGDRCNGDKQQHLVS